MIDEYASIRFTFVCTTAMIDPTNSGEHGQHPDRPAASRRDSSAARPTSTRSSAANAAALPADAMNAVTGVGAPWYTSGAQKWNGTAADLEPEADEQQRHAGEHQRVVAVEGTVASSESKIVVKFVLPVPP